MISTSKTEKTGKNKKALFQRNRAYFASKMI